MKSAWDAGISRVQALAENMSTLQSSQNQVNIYTTRQLESIEDRLERHANTMADHTSSIRMLIDKVMTK